MNNNVLQIYGFVWENESENTNFNKLVIRGTQIIENHGESQLRDVKMQLETIFLADALEGHGR